MYQYFLNIIKGIRTLKKKKKKRETWMVEWSTDI